MLEYAKKYEEELRKIFFDVAFDPFYNFYQYAVYREIFELPKDTWSGNHFVSVFQGAVIGYIGYSIKRAENQVTCLNAAHFGGETAKNKFIFGKDLMTALKDVFEKFGFNKISFTVVIGNSIEKTYDKLVRIYGGRIVGIFRQDVRLIDGKLYDAKYYEILAEDYFRAKNAGALKDS
jgi:hypothetical protein